MPVHVCFCLWLSVSCTFFLFFICFESNFLSLLSPFCSSSESWPIHLQHTTYLLCTPYVLFKKNTRVTCSSALSGLPSSSYLAIFLSLYPSIRPVLFSYGRSKGLCLIRVLSLGRRIFHVNFRTKWHAFCRRRLGKVCAAVVICGILPVNFRVKWPL